MILTNRQLQTIVKEVKQSPSLTGQKVAYYVKEMFDKKISGRIIQRTLNRVNLKSLISKKNLTQRMKFARDHINKDQNLKPTVKHGGDSVMVWDVWLRTGLETFNF